MAQKRTFPAIPAIAIILFLVIMAGFLPATFAQSQGNQTTTLTLDERNFVTVKPPIETGVSLVQELNGTYQLTNLTVYNRDTGTSETITTLDQGNSTEFQLSGETVNVTFVHSIGNDNAVVKYTYPTTYGWGPIQITFAQSMGVIVLILFVYMIAKIIDLGGDE